jgi:hypothetical protein
MDSWFQASSYRISSPFHLWPGIPHRLCWQSLHSGKIPERVRDKALYIIKREYSPREAMDNFFRREYSHISVQKKILKIWSKNAVQRADNATANLDFLSKM